MWRVISVQKLFRFNPTTMHVCLGTLCFGLRMTLPMGFMWPALFCRLRTTYLPVLISITDLMKLAAKNGCYLYRGGSRIWLRGSPNFFGQFLPTPCSSHANELSPFWPGSRAHLRALEAVKVWKL